MASWMKLLRLHVWLSQYSSTNSSNHEGSETLIDSVVRGKPITCLSI